MKQFFMLDIESTGVRIHSDKILEIGILDCRKDPLDGLWKPGAHYRRIMHYGGVPTTPFAKEHLSDLYLACNQTPVVEPRVIRNDILSYFYQCGADKTVDIVLGGWNASSFDVPMMHSHGILYPPHYETVHGKDVQVGDHSHRYYEIGGAIALAMDILECYDRKAIIERALELGKDTAPFDGRQHEALYDCYRQLRILNGLIRAVCLEKM